MVYTIIVAGGKGERFSKNIKKQFYKLSDKTILELTIEKFNDHPLVDAITVVLPQEELCYYSFLDTKYSKVRGLISGGNTRFQSVYNGLKSLKGNYNITTDKILIHDGVRPLISRELITNVITSLDDFNCVIPGIRIHDNIKKVDFESFVTSTVEREKLFTIQTPQGFKGDIITLYDIISSENIDFKDDASVVESFGWDVKVIEGEKSNIKITNKEDIEFFYFFDGAKMNQKIGFGFDVHKFTKNRKLILGGVDIPSDKGLDGHSDADVVIHALIDALLGASGSGDIGEHFPDNDVKYKDINSLKLLDNIFNQLISPTFNINSIDITVVCEFPKLKKFKYKMKQNISNSLGVPENLINIKATTTEGLGFTGRREGIAAYAVVSLTEIKKVENV